MNLKYLGFTTWFEEKSDPQKLNDYQLARVLAVNKDNFLIKNENVETLAELTGKMLFQVDSSLDFPAVGDWVYAQFFDDETFGVIHDILPRKSILKRKTSGKKIDFQLIAANVDKAFIMQSLDHNFNPNRLERYLAMVHEGGVQPIVLLSKSDLLDSENIERKLSELDRITPDLEIIPFSNKTGVSVDKIKSMLRAGETYCLIGSSGVGKTTLLNHFLGDDVFETKSVRQSDGKGRHATSRRQLIILQNGAMIIDTPGMRELGNFGIETGVQDTFPEIIKLSKNCHFQDCTHTHEKGCAVLSAVQNGSLLGKRYGNYIRLKKESDYYVMSYLEKRQKDKSFGKMIKQVKKIKKRTE